MYLYRENLTFQSVDEEEEVAVANEACEVLHLMYVGYLMFKTMCSVLTDDCMQFLKITDASCVIHFSFPSSPTIFGQRLYNMSDNFHNVIKV